MSEFHPWQKKIYERLMRGDRLTFAVLPYRSGLGKARLDLFIYEELLRQARRGQRE